MVGQLGGLCVAWKSCVPFRSRSSRTPSLSGRLNTSEYNAWISRAFCLSTNANTHCRTFLAIPNPNWGVHAHPPAAGEASGAQGARCTHRVEAVVRDELGDARRHHGGLCRRRQVPWHDIGLPAAAYELIIDGGLAPACARPRVFPEQTHTVGGLAGCGVAEPAPYIHGVNAGHGTNYTAPTTDGGLPSLAKCSNAASVASTCFSCTRYIAMGPCLALLGCALLVPSHCA